jgi:hypothetical protein
MPKRIEKATAAAKFGKYSQRALHASAGTYPSRPGVAYALKPGVHVGVGRLSDSGGIEGSEIETGGIEMVGRLRSSENARGEMLRLDTAERLMRDDREMLVLTGGDMNVIEDGEASVEDGVRDGEAAASWVAGI